MIWMSGTDKSRNYFNQPWLDFTARPLEVELGNGWTQGVHPEDLQSSVETYTRAFDLRESFQMQYRLRRHDGEFRWVFDTGVPRFNADGSFAGYIGSCLDITERKLAEEALASLGGKLIAAQEQERARIARELHDDINQQLAFLSMSLDELRENPSNSMAAIQRRLEGLGAQASEIANSVQALSHRLHSSKLEVLRTDCGSPRFLPRVLRSASRRGRVLARSHPRELAAGDLTVPVSGRAGGTGQCPEAQWRQVFRRSPAVVAWDSSFDDPRCRRRLRCREDARRPRSRAYQHA